MDGVVYTITQREFWNLLDPKYKTNPLEVAVNLSADLLVGMFNGRPLCFIGLANRTLLSSEAYVWMLVTDYGQEHPLILARHGKSVLQTIMSKYTYIFGHCFNKKSADWLRALGAVFTSEIEFEFRR